MAFSNSNDLSVSSDLYNNDSQVDFTKSCSTTDAVAVTKSVCSPQNTVIDCSAWTDDSISDAYNLPSRFFEERYDFLRMHPRPSRRTASDFHNLHPRKYKCVPHAWYLSELADGDLVNSRLHKEFFSYLREHMITVELDCPYFCDKCSVFATTCRHQIPDFDFPFAVATHDAYGKVLKNDYSLSISSWPRGRANFILSLFGYHGAAAYYSSWRAVWIASDSMPPRLRHSLDWFLTIVLATYPKEIDPQFALEDFAQQFLDTFNTIRAVVVDLFSACKTYVRTKMVDFVSTLIALVANPREVGSKMCSAVSDAIGEACPQIVKDIPFFILIKTCIRYWFGYSPLQIVTEILWDTTFYQFLEKWAPAVRDMFWSIFTSIKHRSSELGAAVSSGVDKARGKLEDYRTNASKKYESTVTEISVTADEFLQSTSHLLRGTQAPNTDQGESSGTFDVDSEDDPYTDFIDGIPGPEAAVPEGDDKEKEEIKAEGAEDFAQLFAVLGTGFLCSTDPDVLDTNYVRRLLQNIVLSATAAQRTGISNSITDLIDYFKGETADERETIRLRSMYPAAFAFIECHASLSEEPLPSQLAHLQSLYKKYQVEMNGVLQGDHAFLLSKTSMARQFATSRGLQPISASRKAPSFWLFQGPPGLGKSELSNALGRTLSKAMARDMAIKLGSQTFPDDYFYAHAALDKYCSGYSQTKNIWLFDDFLQKKDSAADPSPCVALLFDLVNSVSFTVNMAEVSSKGMQGSCDVVVGSTNAPITDDWLSANIKSIQEPRAFRRRINRLVRPLIQKPYSYSEQNRCILDADGARLGEQVPFEQLFLFEVSDASGSPIAGRSGKLWTWSELVGRAYREMCSCRDYAAPGVVDQSLIYCEGWMNKLFGRWCKCAAFNNPNRVCHCNVDGLVCTDFSPVYKFEFGGRLRAVPAGCEFIPAKYHSDYVTYVPKEPPSSCSNCEPSSTWNRPCRRCATTLTEGTDIVGGHAYGLINGPGEHSLYVEASYVEPFSEKHRYSWKSDVALLIGVLLAAVGGYHIAKRAIKTGYKACSKHIGLLLYRDADGTEKHVVGGEKVEPEGRYEFDQGGKRYVTITYRSGLSKTYLLAQGLSGNATPKFSYEEHGHMICPRFKQQIPSYQDNLFAVVSSIGQLVGNVFALDSRRFVTPAHVARYMENFDYCLVRGNQTRTFKANVGIHVHIRNGGDLACVEYLGETFPFLGDRIRKMKNRIESSVSPTGGVCLMTRDEKGDIKMQLGSFGPVNSPLVYQQGDNSYEIKPKEGRIVSGVTTQIGSCGGLYLTTANVASRSLLGFHIGAKEGKAYFHTIDAHWVDSIENVAVPDTHPTLVASPSAGGLLSAAGFEVARAAYPVIPTRGRVQRFANITSKYVSADVAPVRPFVNDGIFYHPGLNATTKLHGRLLQPEPNLEHMFDFVADLASLFDEVDSKTRSWNQVVSSGDLPSVDRAAVPGPGYSQIGPTKNIMFEEGDDVVLTADAIQLLDVCHGIILPHDWATRPLSEFGEFLGPTSYNLKDESRPDEKAKIGATRPYMVTGFADFILQRKFFYDVVAAFHKKNLSYCSALGIDPADWSAMSHILFDGKKHALTADFKYMDGSFSPIVGQLCAYFIICLYGNESSGDRRKVHSCLPALTKDNFARWLLIDRLMNYRTVYQTEEAVPNRSHPSGSFITTLLNIVWQIIMWHYVIQKTTGHSLVDIRRKHFDFAFLGDDSVITTSLRVPPSPAKLEQEAKELGFTITSSEKDKNIEWYPSWNLKGKTDYLFLSRHFSCNSEGVICGLLTPERMFKMLCFCSNPSKISEIYPSVVYNFYSELLQWISYDPLDEVVSEGNRMLHFILGDEVGVLATKDPTEIMSAVSRRIMSNPDVFILEQRFDSVVLVPEGRDDKGKGKAFVTSGGSNDHEGLDADDEALRNASRGGSSRYTEHAASISTQTARSDGCVTTATGDADLDIGVFASNQPAVVATLAEHDTKWVTSGMCANSTEIDGIFKRPYLFTNDVTGSPPANHLLQCLFLPSIYFGTDISGPAHARTLMRQYAYLRCTTCIRIVVSSTPTTSGKLLASVRYGLEEASDVYEAASDISIELDASSGTAGVLKVPTMIPHGWSQTSTAGTATVPGPLFDYANFTLWTLTAPSSTIRYTIYVWLEDIDLRVPYSYESYSAIGPQGLDTVRELSRDVFATASRGVKTASGVVMSVMNIIDSAAKFAALVGLSAPAKSTPGDFMNSTVSAPHFPHLIGPVLSTRMAIAQEQRTVQPDGTWGCIGDDMDIRAVCSRPGIIAVGNWNGTGFLTKFPINPGVYNEISTHRWAGHMCYVSYGFRMWRGTIKYRIALSKTPFHGGQLTIVYQPGNVSTPAATSRDAPYNHKISWDTAQSASIEFSVPYCSCLPWSDVWYTNGNNPVDSHDDCDCTGSIWIYGETAPIVTSDATGNGLVVNNVPYVVYAWSDDIEFAIPCITNFLDMDPDVFEPQIGPWGDAIAAGVECSAPVEMFPANPTSSVTNSSCVGESIPNLRLLTRKIQQLFTTSDVHAVKCTLNDVLRVNQYMRWLKHIYVYLTGGFRIAYAIGGNAANADVPLIATRYYRNSDHFPVSAQIARAAKGSVQTFDVPYQSPVPFVAVNLIEKDEATVSVYDSLELKMMYSGSTTTIPTGNVFGCGADDFTFGCLRAPPSQLAANAIREPPAAYFVWDPDV